MADFLKGVIVGLTLAMPVVGPVGLVCIRRTATGGRLLGFVSGLGSATADTLCGFVAAVGLSSLTSFLSAHRELIQGIGGCAMVAIGLSILLDRQAADDGGRQGLNGADLVPAYFSTLGLTLATPMTLAACTGLLAAIGFSHGSGIESVATLLAGIFTGSAAWWLILTIVVGWLGSRLKPSMLTGMNRIVGGAIAVAGAAYLVGGIRR